MKRALFVVIVIFAVSCCRGQKISKEDFLNAMLAEGGYYSVDDTDHSTTVIANQCTYPVIHNDFYHMLPDTCFLQMEQRVKKDSGKVFYWNKENMHVPAWKKLYFVTPDEINLLMDMYTAYDTGGTAAHRDSVARRIREINKVKKKYNNASGYYVFYAPVFDASYRYAIFYHEHFCKGVFCGDGACDLWEHTNGKWKKVTVGSLIEY